MLKTNKNQRADLVLNLIIEHYLRQGTPIPSKQIATAPEIGASPATVRNVMCALESQGLIYSPHTSAGRIPTVQGLRAFVNGLLNCKQSRSNSLQQLTTSLSKSVTPEDMCKKASQLIADMTRMTGLVVMPKTNDVVIRQLELVRLADRRLLCVLIDEHDQVQNRVVDLERPVSELVLQQTLQLLNTALAGFTLDEGGERLGFALKHVEPEVSNLVRLALFGDTLERNEQVVFASGETRLLTSDISDDTATLRRLLKFFEDISPLNHLFGKCSQDNDVKVFIGKETGVEAFENCSLVTKAFCKDGKPAGVIAVVGPIRMDYQTVISSVDMTANILSSALNRQL